MEVLPYILHLCMASVGMSHHVELSLSQVSQHMEDEQEARAPEGK